MLLIKKVSPRASGLMSGLGMSCRGSDSFIELRPSLRVLGSGERQYPILRLTAMTLSLVGIRQNPLWIRVFILTKELMTMIKPGGVHLCSYVLF
jgi:hypothetical protein